jgi:hypothetical protein
MSENPGTSAPATEMNAAVDVTVSIPIAQILAARVDPYQGYDGYDDAGSVQELVRGDVARIIANEMRPVMREELQAAIRAAVDERVREALTSGDVEDFGGSRKTLRQAILDAAQEWPTSRVPGDTYGRETNLQALIKTTVQREFQNELRPVIDAVKKEIKAAIVAQGTEMVLKAAKDVMKVTVL